MAGKTRKLKSPDYIIAIPSYKRAEILKEKTLTTLHKYKIPKEKIYVFVANKEEHDIYKESLDPSTYGHLVIGVPGLAAVRNFISRERKLSVAIMISEVSLSLIRAKSATKRSLSA
jgi:cellulose synthase/poly-beta-1,6-N-acetylglucosamine synthase-like glycosyltransferase